MWGEGPKVSGEAGPASRPASRRAAVLRTAPGCAPARPPGSAWLELGACSLLFSPPMELNTPGGGRRETIGVGEAPPGKCSRVPGRLSSCAPHRCLLPKLEGLSVGYDVPETRHRHPFAYVFVLFCWLILYTNRAERLFCFCNMLQFASWLNVSYYLRPSCF